jgi:hypothetical protein
LGQWLVGFLFNDLLMASGFAVPILIIGLLVLSLLTAMAHDRTRVKPSIRDKTVSQTEIGVP